MRPDSAPVQVLNVAIISPSEYSAMVMSDLSPEVSLKAEEIEQSQKILESLPILPEEELAVTRASELKQVTEAAEPESQPARMEPNSSAKLQVTEDLPLLTTPSENVFALLKSPMAIEAPHKSERIAPIAVAPLPSELSIDDQLQETRLRENLDRLSTDKKEPPEFERKEKADQETATQITPEISEELPASEEISLRPQSRLELQEILSQPQEPELNQSNREEDQSANKVGMGAPDTSLRPKVRPESAPSLGQNKKPRNASEKAELQSAINAKLKDAITDLDQQNVISELTPQQENIVRTTVKKAVKPYWIIDPGSPASIVKLILRLEFNKNGKVKEESIKLISSEGGDEKAVRRALRAAITAVKRASLKGAFALPEETFDGWKILELEFDPEEMRKR